MPRLAPQFNGKPAVLEHRITFGTLERKIIDKQIQRQNTLNLTRSLGQAFGPIAIGLGVLGTGYLLARGITQIANSFSGNPIDGVKKSANEIFKGSRGLNPDGSFQTWLCVQGGSGIGNFSSYEGQVIVYTGFAGTPILGGISGAFSKVAAAISVGAWIEVIGNFNKDARNVSQLSDGWLPKSQYDDIVNRGYEYEGSDSEQANNLGYGEDMGDYATTRREGSYRYSDFFDTTGTYESAWSINGMTYEEWVEAGSPITDAWLEYIRANPDRFTPESVAYFERLKEYQENYWSEENPAPVPADTTTPVFNYDDDGDGIPNWEDEDYEGSVDYGSESTE